MKAPGPCLIKYATIVAHEPFSSDAWRDGQQEPPGALDILVQRGIEERIFSAAVVGVSLLIDGVARSVVLSWGKGSFLSGAPRIDDHTLFDLASLTKPLATTLALLSLVDEGAVHLDDPLSVLLEREVEDGAKREITLRHLLNHCSGLAAHRPYFKKLVHLLPSDRRRWLITTILSEKLEYTPGQKSLYSDLGFILLGYIVALKSGRDLEASVRERVLAPLGLAERIIYNPLQKGKTSFAATEKCPWRGRLLQGEVHDQNTFAVGGASGQAGLFGDGASVLFCVTRLLQILAGTASHPRFSAAGLCRFCKREQIVPHSSWALGFDTPSPHGSSAGSLIDADSVGHLGFTGTSFWIDRQKKAAVLLLTNRVHANSDQQYIRRFRPLFHDTVFQELRGGWLR